MGAYSPGYKRRIFYGTAGTTAATLIEDAVDIDVTGANSRFDTTVRGDSLSVPIHTEGVDQLNRTVSFGMRYDPDDATTANLIAAEKTGAGVAIKVERASGGEVEYDGDVTLNLTSPGPLVGGMDLTFECVPSRDYGRVPAFS